jgi:hypothetical protein
MATRIRRDFISHCMIVKLHEIDPRTQRKRFVRGIEALVRQFEKGDLAVIKFVTERFEGVLPIDLTISGPNGRGLCCDVESAARQYDRRHT